mgnify:CR=1 FL=1
MSSRCWVVILGVDLGSLSMTDLLEDLLAIFQKNHLKASSQITILEKASLQIEVFPRVGPKYGFDDFGQGLFPRKYGP